MGRAAAARTIVVGCLRRLQRRQLRQPRRVCTVSRSIRPLPAAARPGGRQRGGAGAGRIEVLEVRQDSAGFARYLAALEARHEATGRQVILVLDNGPCHVSKLTRAALAERAAWLQVIPLARYSPHLNPKEHEWRRFKRDHRGHLAPTSGLRGRGGGRLGWGREHAVLVEDGGNVREGRLAGLAHTC